MVKIFVGNLSPETTSDELRSLFSQYGKIAECSILKSFGFVHMDSKAEAEEAIRNLHQYQLNGQAMNVELSRGKTRGSTKLHVGNIACTNQELRAKFEEYGVVVECDIVKNYAFVHMERMEDAMEAINQLDNTAFKDRPICGHKAAPASEPSSTELPGHVLAGKCFLPYPEVAAILNFFGDAFLCGLCIVRCGANWRQVCTRAPRRAGRRANGHQQHNGFSLAEAQQRGRKAQRSRWIRLQKEEPAGWDEGKGRLHNQAAHKQVYLCIICPRRAL
ncbi:RNA-binding protein 4.1-like isoform X4 [Phycodurus eques]|uniref:RNA-binding protein 4.1-like isoform X4 n=1 Tax=Phycodurus eques TaxID=693459 RepID=UPI002ACE0D8C|nr:RNA-binding protein 4.1-like isoform X4 [Phycodurus eques]